MKNSSRRIALALAAGALSAGCVGPQAEHRGVPLVWLDAQETPVAVKSNLAPHRFKVARFVDRRADPSVIGVNIQHPDHPLQVTTKDDVAAWSTDRFAHVLRRQGVEIVQSGETATLHVEIVKLMVTEAGLFNGDVELNVTAKGLRGHTLWRGALAGRSKRWGRTYNLENYYEALTNAFESASRDLLSNPAFLAALGH